MKAMLSPRQRQAIRFRALGKKLTPKTLGIRPDHFPKLLKALVDHGLLNERGDLTQAGWKEFHRLPPGERSIYQRELVDRGES